MLRQCLLNGTERCRAQGKPSQAPQGQIMELRSSPLTSLAGVQNIINDRSFSKEVANQNEKKMDLGVIGRVTTKPTQFLFLEH